MHVFLARLLALGEGGCLTFYLPLVPSRKWASMFAEVCKERVGISAGASQRPSLQETNSSVPFPLDKKKLAMLFFSR